jgi:flagellar assembly protein FliH
VKSIAVVPGERTKDNHALKPDTKVIKRNYAGNPAFQVSTDYRSLAPKDPYLAELNRIKVEIEEARAELRHLRGELERPAEPRETAGEDGAEEAAAEEADAPMVELVAKFDEREARELIQAAEQDAKEIHAQAVLEAQRITQQAQNDGYLEGFNKGYEEAAAEFKRANDPQAERIADLVEDLSEYEQKRLKQNEKELVELTLAVAAKVIGQELAANPGAIVNMLTETVRQNHSEEYVRITLAEDLLPVDVKASAEIKELLLGLGANVSVLADSKAAPGAVQVETPKGIIDLSVDTQLKNIRDILGNAE